MHEIENPYNLLDVLMTITLMNVEVDDDIFQLFDDGN